jgi:hypothetical protein
MSPFKFHEQVNSNGYIREHSIVPGSSTVHPIGSWTLTERWYYVSAKLVSIVLALNPAFPLLRSTAAALNG